MSTPHKDEITGVETTGHEWDDIRELNNPLPKWWVYTFYATIVWSLAYFVFMPSWPVFWNGEWTALEGVLGYSQRGAVTEELAAIEEGRADYMQAIAATDISKIQANPELMELAVAGGKALFGDNCAPCHGSGAQGFKGYPNLNDDNWIWGGTLEAIQTTITHGIRWELDDDTRFNMMPRFLTDGILSREEVGNVTDYVLAISGQGEMTEGAEAGAEIFAQQCAACHGESGAGNQELGAPNLTDAIWLYGGNRSDIYESIAKARAGVMPAWGGRLTDAEIKELTLYVHTLGGGQ
ncbi:cytochrome c oxidase, cbb3-type subunit III [Tepidicaulis marinus]|uniref:Cbb3-type cytochrome c oxidase subunit n=1 Tax=Tepidicaulis marinus TaxID=1333998 RepID=A0A081BEI9_9HYPH|nr:cytochrome-c oxidase, cbb3-type subunit III [Tepidicaulis marinus]GAK46457.1 cytochrome c oxidase, cbb3-type subunit III [Tepidicaulis marinus]